MNTKALRAKILDLAIHGKLVPQDPNNESAEKLLEKIRAEKAEKIAKGELKANKNDSYIFIGDDKRRYEKVFACGKPADGTVKDIEDEIPFDVPEGWAWCRLGEICTKLIDGDHNPPKGVDDKTDYLMLSSRNINQDKIIDLENVRYLSEDMFQIENKRTNLQKGDILFTSVGSLGRSCIFNGNGSYCFQRSVTVLNTKINNEYVKYFFDSSYYQKVILDNATGTAQLGFYLEQMGKSLIALPPLAEQKLIVQKIQEIFAQIDLLEQNKSDLQTSIKHAKSKILDLAIHGKLVPQDASDEPASKLLEKIRAEKEAKIAAGELKRDKNESYIYKNPADNCHYRKFIDGHEENVDDEIPFDLSEGWAWCKLGDIFSHNTGKALNRTKLAGEYRDYITTSNVYWDRFELNDVGQMPFTAEELSKCTVTKGDLLICEGGDIGRSNIWDKDYDICIQNHLHRLRAYVPVETKLFYYWLMLYKQKNMIVGKGIGLMGFSSNLVHNLLIPLPPLAEQHRIVAKIEELFSTLDTLTNSLTS